jgi:antibiotic biosynthesis monooxygenase (ABM) superfamily enzyme
VYIVVVTLLYEWVVMPGEHTIKQKWTHPRPKHY